MSGWQFLPLTPLPPPNWSISASPVDEAVLRNDVFDKASGLKADVLLDVIEANQIIPSVKSLAGCLPEMARNWKRIRKVLSTASGAFLAWKFGVSPLLADIGAIHNALPGISDAIQKFKRGDHKRVSRVVTCSSNFSRSQMTTPYLGVNLNEASFFGSVIDAPKIRYVLVIKPNQRYASDAFNAAAVLASKFATSPANLAWEKVPFSFVVDWFVDLRGILRSIDNFVGFHPYEVVSFTRSFAYELKTRMEFKGSSICNGGTLLYSDPDAASMVYRHYERTPVSTAPDGAVWSPRFGKTQAGISAALITQQLTKL
jgi:hypothetical protein